MSYEYWGEQRIDQAEDDGRELPEIEREHLACSCGEEFTSYDDLLEHIANGVRRPPNEVHVSQEAAAYFGLTCPNCGLALPCGGHEPDWFLEQIVASAYAAYLQRHTGANDYLYFWKGASNGTNKQAASVGDDSAASQRQR